MSQLSNKIINLNPNKSLRLFDIQCIIDSMPYGVGLFDYQLKLIKWNKSFTHILGINDKKIKPNLNIADIFSPKNPCRDAIEKNLKTLALIQEMYKECTSGSSFHWAYKYILKNGATIDLNAEFFPNKGVIINFSDHNCLEPQGQISPQLEKEYLELQTNEAIYHKDNSPVTREDAAKTQHFQTILNAMEEGLITINMQGAILSSNNAMSVIFGYTPSELQRMSLNDLIVSRKIKQSDDIENLLELHNDGAKAYKAGETGYRKNGNRFPLKIDVREVYIDTEKHYTVLFRDVTEQFEAEKLIRKMALHDNLTELSNRYSLVEKLSASLKLAKRLKKKVAVMVLDLDKFKPVNDIYGHAVGDKLLKVVSGRLLNCAREVDTVARLGGDEFAMVFTNIEDDKNIVTIADRIINSIQKPIELDGNIIQIGTSIGISFYPDDASTPVELIRMAELALYQAKEDGRRVYRLYDPQMDADTKVQKQIETDLNKALENDELLLHYQPQFSADNYKLVGVEALIRWNHPEKGMIPPYQFIPVAELSGLMIPIGQWVLNTACKAAQEWHKAGLPKITLCVNISARQFHTDNFVDTIENALNISGLDPACLELEITEGMVIKNTDSVVTKLEALKELGIKLSIDDFGTGYSSLAYLKRFPVNKLKIDQSFVRDIHEDPDDAAITDAVIRLGHSLGLSVVAEGVETEEHVRILKEKGCDVFQGYHFCRPIGHDEFVKFIREYNK